MCESGEPGVTQLDNFFVSQTFNLFLNMAAEILLGAELFD